MTTIILTRHGHVDGTGLSGFCSSPGPPIAIGIMPTTMATAVISTGLALCLL